MANDQTRQHKSSSTETRLELDVPHNPSSAPLLDKAVEVPRGWPTSPKRIKTSVYTLITNTLVDFILLACSVAFLAFALTVNRYDQHPITENESRTKTLLNATKYGPTVFPILFAAVLGRATHAILLWRLERGERIGVVDILAGSSSLTSTVTSQLQLRVVSFLGLLLIVIWALSPVGGQAALRQMSIRDKKFSQPANYTYMVPDGNLDGYGPGSESASYAAIVNTLFNAAIIGPAAIKSSPLDLWGNVKIPLVEHYENTSMADSDGWFDTKPMDGHTEPVYTSLVGVPISNINSSGFIDYNMNLETFYLSLNCSIVSLMLPPEGAYNVTAGGTWIWWFDDTSAVPHESNRSNIAPEDLTPFNFTYVGSLGTPIQCLTTTTYVEVQISCQTASTCTAAKIRRSRLDHPPMAFTQFDLIDLASGGHYSNWYSFVVLFLSSAGGGSSYSSMLDNYLAAPDSPGTMPITFFPTPNRTQESDNIYSLRLAQLFNAYWTCMNGPYAISGGLVNDTAYLDPNTTFMGKENYQLANEYNALANWTTDAKARTWLARGSRSTQDSVIQAHTGWVVALSIASTVLILASLVPPFIRYFLIKGPDLMMNISSLATRNNPHIPLPNSGTYMDASDRARLLKEYMVRFGDMNGTADVGSLALGSLTASEVSKIERVPKGRVYE